MAMSTPATPSEMGCQELVELVTEYLERKMSPADAARFEAHLAICRGCRAYLKQMQRTISVLGRLREEWIPEDAIQKLLQTFRDWKRTRPPE